MIAPVAAAGVDGSRHGPSAKKPSPELMSAAQQFESMLLRTMLKPLERSTRVSADSDSGSPGAGLVGSLVVDALADAVAQAGGMGLASLLAEAAMSASPSQTPPSNTPEPNPPQGSTKKTVHQIRVLAFPDITHPTTGKVTSSDHVGMNVKEPDESP
jgi:Rod binding domain-containing protein